MGSDNKDGALVGWRGAGQDDGLAAGSESLTWLGDRSAAKTTRMGDVVLLLVNDNEHMENTMTTTYRLAYVYMDYSHEETIELSTDKDSILISYHQFVKNTLEENDPDHDAIDYVSVQDAYDNEKIIVEYDFNG